MAEEKKQLGRILLKQKLISQAELDSVLAEQQKGPIDDRKPLASRLTEKGLIKETDALRALSEQFGVPGIDLSQVAILLEHLDSVPREIAEAGKILPVLVRDDRLFLAMANPLERRVLDELEFVTGKKVYPYVAISTTLERAIRDAYDAKAAGEPYYLGPAVPDSTLRQLGIERAQMPTLAKEHPEAAPARRVPDSIAPASPAVVVDDTMTRARLESKLDENEQLSDEVSRVAPLPDDIKGLRTSGSVAQKLPTADGKLILVVDDEEDIRKMLRRLLSEKGHRVIEADRGLLALRMVKENAPDLIILDAMLPELHGFDIARRLKGSEKYGSIPIIMISAVYRGWRIAEDLRQNYGITEYLEKPFRISDVITAVSRALEAGSTKRSGPANRDPEAIDAEAEEMLKQGVVAYRAGEIDRAIELLKKGTAIDPLAYRLRYHLALLYGKKGLVYEGIGELERAVDMNPKHFPALKNLAVLYEKAGFKHKAIEMWERSVQVAPDAATRAQIKEHLLTLL
jgi:CheY-like chemotaxis protein